MQNNFIPIRKHKKFNYQCGQQFGRLTYTGRTYTKIIYGQWRRFIEAVCVCGEVREYLFQKVACGETQSCGCLRSDLTRKRMTTHNLTNHPLYDVHAKMISRCYNEKDPAFHNYGGRNIEVWKDWREDFMCFYNWCMENGYKEGLSLDREDNDGNYAPHNCRFGNFHLQSRNRRNSRNFTAFGETKCLFDWGNDPRCVVGVWGLRSRVDSDKWKDDFEGALTTPEDRKKAGRTKKNNVYVTAFGETKCLAEWVEDKRCVVAMDRLRDRIAEGWDHLEAITKPHKDKKDIDLTAFGETKTMAQWLRDERCKIKVDGLRSRIRSGWEHEDAISTPSKTGSTHKKSI